MNLIMNFVLAIQKQIDLGWRFKKNEAGRLSVFHPEYGSHIFSTEDECRDWIASMN